MGGTASKKHAGEEDSSQGSQADLQLQKEVEEFRQQWNDAFATLQRECHKTGASSKARQALKDLKAAHQKVEALAVSLHCENQDLNAELETMRGQMEAMEDKMHKMTLHVEERDANFKQALVGMQQQIRDLQAAKAAATAAPEKAAATAAPEKTAATAATAAPEKAAATAAPEKTAATAAPDTAAPEKAAATAATAAATAAPERATEAAQAADKAADRLADQVAKLLLLTACPNVYYSKSAPAQISHQQH